MMSPLRFIVPLAAAVVILAASEANAQFTSPLSDKVMDLRGEWKRDPSRGVGGICGVSVDDTVAFDITPEPPTVTIRSGRLSAVIPLDGSSAAQGVDRTVVAATDAGWLKVTMTQARNGGFANVMQDVFILNRDRTELTLWRTLNVVMPDGSSGKIDCGNRVAVVYVRQK